jgi:hypothetical protein
VVPLLLTQRSKKKREQKPKKRQPVDTDGERKPKKQRKSTEPSQKRNIEQDPTHVKAFQQKKRQKAPVEEDIPDDSDGESGGMYI